MEASALWRSLKVTFESSASLVEGLAPSTKPFTEETTVLWSGVRVHDTSGGAMVARSPTPYHGYHCYVYHYYSPNYSCNDSYGYSHHNNLGSLDPYGLWLEST